jgi:transposase
MAQGRGSSSLSTPWDACVLCVLVLALDGVSWVQGGSVEIAVSHGCCVQQNRRRRLLPPWASLLMGAGFGLLAVQPAGGSCGAHRRRGRERARLVNERGQHLNRIKGLLMTQGVSDFASGRRIGRPAHGNARELPLHLRQEIERECRRLWLAVEMIAEVKVKQQQAAKADETTGTESRAAAQLSRLRGIAPATANMLVDEVFFRDFKNRRELGDYFGLVSSPWSSGVMNRDQGLAGSGNPRARRTAFETRKVESRWWVRI